jgi:hypothetical protein
LIFRTLIFVLLSVGMWVTATGAAVHNDYTPTSYIDLNDSGTVVEEVDFCCHKSLADICPPSHSRNSSILLAPKKLALGPPPAANLAYTDLMPDHLLCETGTICYSELPRSFVTAPIYLTTLRLRL